MNNTIHIIIAEQESAFSLLRIGAVKTAMVVHPRTAYGMQAFSDATGALKAIREIGDAKNIIMIVGQDLKPMTGLELFATLRGENLLPDQRILCADHMPARNSHPEVSSGLIIAGRTTDISDAISKSVWAIKDQQERAAKVVPASTLAGIRAARADGKPSRRVPPGP